jgi:hypothetical protein
MRAHNKNEPMSVLGKRKKSLGLPLELNSLELKKPKKFKQKLNEHQN